MSYKFSLGTYKHSGELSSSAGLNIAAGGLSVVGAVALPNSSIQTAEIEDAAITNEKVLSGSIHASKIILSAVDAGGDGSFSYSSGTGAFTYTGPSAAEARAHLSAVDAGGDGSFSYADGVFTYTGPSAAEVRAHLSATDGVQYNSGVISLTSSVAGDGLVYVAGVLSVGRGGAINLINDKVILSSSVAGNGISATANSGAVGSLQVIYGTGANTATQGNVSWSIAAGAGMTGDSSGVLGGGIASTLTVVSDNAGIVVGANGIALTLHDANALEIAANGLSLKSTIAGARTFSDNVTISGDLFVAGTQVAVDSTNVMLKDPVILLGSASAGVAVNGDRGIMMSISASNDPVMFWDNSEAHFAFARTDSAHTDTTINAVTYADLKVNALISATGISEAIQTLSTTGVISSAVVLCDATAAGFTATLPAASDYTGKFLKVKKSEGSANVVVLDGNGAETIDGVSTISLESPYAAVMLVSNGSNWFVF